MKKRAMLMGNRNLSLTRKSWQPRVTMTRHDPNVCAANGKVQKSNAKAGQVLQNCCVDPPHTMCHEQVIAALKAGARSDGEVSLILERQKT